MGTGGGGSSAAFGADYRERVTLRDGRVVLLRMLTPQDRDALERGFAELSSESRYLRFFTVKAHLTDDELDYLVHTDDRNHVAICAIAHEPAPGASDASVEPVVPVLKYQSL